ncbi:MAG: hypothetical protein VZR27_08715 [Acutalibacteraceae bacterium]|nr:hypothetical protein [Acutalibacteraceae bacterium]
MCISILTLKRNYPQKACRLTSSKYNIKGISKNLPSFRCAVDLVGRRHFKIAGCSLLCGRRCRKATAPTEPAGETHTDVCQDFLCNMTAEDTVQMDGVRFLEVPLMLRYF